MSGEDTLIGADLLFSSIKIGAIDMQNRIVMSPMTRHQASHGVLFDSDYYTRRAAGGCGLIITEGVAPDHIVSDFMDDCPAIETPAEVAAWKNVAEGVHRAGAPIVMQLWHTGIRRPLARSYNPDLPSASPSGFYPFDWPHRFEPSTDAEIEGLIATYARSAALAKSAGYDGVEVHGAHGYLPDQFFWKMTNKRTDRWGGDISGRVRFACEVVKAIKAATAADYPVFFRFSQWKLDDYNARLAETPQELAGYLEPLADAGVDLFDASTRRFWIPEFDGSNLNLAGWAKKITGKPSMTVGSVGLEGPLDSTARLRGHDEANVGFAGLEPLYERLDRGEFDLVGVGRALLANADFANLVREGRFDDLTPYTSETANTALA